MKVPTLILDTVDSTMLEAERLAESGRNGPLVICAGAQTGGVGRHGRAWASPPGNLYWTVLLNGEADRPRDAGLAFAAGLAVLDALAACAVPAHRLSLKWPNDVMLDGRKLAGVLAQSTMTGQSSHTVVGIGINVASAPPNTAYPATALRAANISTSIETLRDALTDAFMLRRNEWRRGGLGPLRDAVAARLHGVGAQTQIAVDRNRDQVLTGVNEGLTPTGALRLRSLDGRSHDIVAGDILA